MNEEKRPGSKISHVLILKTSPVSSLQIKFSIREMDKKKEEKYRISSVTTYHNLQIKILSIWTYPKNPS